MIDLEKHLPKKCGFDPKKIVVTPGRPVALAADIRERQFWPQYTHAYEQVFTHTSTPWAPWFVIPADHKWFTRLCVSQVIVAALKSLDLRYPTVPTSRAEALEKAKQELLSEK
jgi:hypothetical protein